MKILFIHPNMPGQYKHLARIYGEDPSCEVYFITQNVRQSFPGVVSVSYKTPPTAHKETHRYLRGTENAVFQGQAVWRSCKNLRDSRNFIPDIIVAHPGWGDAMFVKDVYPETPILSFFEFYYHAKGADMGFDPSDMPNEDAIARTRVRNFLHLSNLENADWGVSPTFWQRDQHPETYHAKLSVIHDGIDTDVARADHKATMTINGKTFKFGDKIITYIARNFEPYRGFPTFMQAAERILKQDPDVHIVAIGADGVSYGKRPSGGSTYRKIWRDKVDLDDNRIHFVGMVPYAKLMKLMQISAAHIYLTYPFVLSWSALEAMSCECAMVVSDTQPLQEVIKDGENGVLVDFFDPKAVAEAVCDMVSHPEKYKAMRKAARSSVMKRYSLKKLLPLHQQLITEVAETGAGFVTNKKIQKLYR